MQSRIPDFGRGTVDPFKRVAAQWFANPDDADDPQDDAQVGNAAPEPAHKKWTVMVYLDGNNTLFGPAYEAMKELEKVGSNPDVNVIVQLGAHPSDKSKGGIMQSILNSAMADKKLDTVRRYKVIKDTSDNKEITSPVLQDLGQADMGDPKTVSDFLKWGIQQYPADHYAVVMFNHGAGFAGILSDENKDSLLNMNDVKSVMADAAKAAGKPIDVLDMDACLMAQDAVADAVKGSAHYLVGSEETERGMAQPLSTVIKDLQEGSKQAAMDPADLSKLFVYEAFNQPSGDLLTSTLSATDLTKMPAVADAADKFAQAVMADPGDHAQVRDAIAQSAHFCQGEPYKLYNDYHDLGDFAQRVSTDPKIKDPKVKVAAANLLAAVQAAVVAEEHSGPLYARASGMSSYLPRNFGFDPKPHTDSVDFAHDQDFHTTPYAQDTHWGQMLQAFSKDSLWHDALKHTGMSKDTIDSVDSTLKATGHLTSSVVGLTAGVGNLMGKWEAVRTLAGATAAVPALNGLGALGGVVEVVDGVKALHDAYTNQAPQGISDLLFDNTGRKVNAGFKIASGAALATANIGMLAGLPPVVTIPAAALAVGLPILKAAYDVHHVVGHLKEEAARMQQPTKPVNVPVQDKLQAMTDHNDHLVRA
ncbi:MAG: clostripain-related cysteine peptidase [Candidatus Xenobia bacterium]